MKDKSFENHIRIRLNEKQLKRLEALLIIENKNKSELFRAILEEYRPKFKIN